MSMKQVEDMAKSLQDKASKFQLNFVAEDTAPLPKSAVVSFSKPAKTNWLSYEVLSNFITEAGKAVMDLEASELKSGGTGKVVVVSEEKAAEIPREKGVLKAKRGISTPGARVPKTRKVEQRKRIHVSDRGRGSPPEKRDGEADIRKRVVIAAGR